VESTGHHATASSGASLHTTNFVSLVASFFEGPAKEAIEGYENLIFGVLTISILSAIFYFASRKTTLIPGRFQSACESVVEGLDAFVCGIIGPQGRAFTPFLGTLFLYIWAMNLIGLVPLMKSNTANSITLQGAVALPVPTTTVALAIIVFITVQTIGIKKQGLLGYLDHMAGTPRDVFGFVMAPLMFPIHVIGEFAKPFSLTFRLFCNTMGGHILVAVFIGMGVTSMLIPFQAPFLLFEIATSTIQAFVFTLLSTVYIAMMMPHGDHEASHDKNVAHSHS
jgi:F-type H+-transporting ATPase subunit a